MEGGIWVDNWLGCIWYNSLFFFIVTFGCETPDSKIEGRKLENIQNGLLKVYIKEEEKYIRGIVIY